MRKNNGISYLFAAFIGFGLLASTGCQKDDPIDDLPIVEVPVEPQGYIDTIMMVNVGGYDLYTETKGEGLSTIVFENGLGGALDTWKEGVYNGLNDSHQLIIYNRGNISPSESTPDGTSRNINQLAKELKVVVDSLSQNEKVILVGHSLGGPIIRAFVNQFPEKVEAMLFVDPAHEGEYTETSIVEFQDSLLTNVVPDIPEMRGVRKEMESLVENWMIMSDLPNLPNIPVTVLTAMSLIDDGEVKTQEEKQAWYDLHAHLGEGVEDFTHLYSDEVGHNIQVDKPQMVIDAILDLIN